MPTNFLWAAGTSNNGLLTTAVTLMTTELESLTSASVIVSSVGGSSGVFTNSNTAQGMLGNIFYYPGNAGCTPTTVGGGLTGWFLQSPDGGTAFESPTAVPVRTPDFFIPLPASAIGGANTLVFPSGEIEVPALEFKVLVQNNCGVTLGAGATTAPYLKLAIYAAQY